MCDIQIRRDCCDNCALNDTWCADTPFDCEGLDCEVCTDCDDYYEVTTA
jgi:hypothetical protein